MASPLVADAELDRCHKHRSRKEVSSTQQVDIGWYQSRRSYVTEEATKVAKIVNQGKNTSKKIN